MFNKKADLFFAGQPFSLFTKMKAVPKGTAALIFNRATLIYIVVLRGDFFYYADIARQQLMDTTNMM